MEKVYEPITDKVFTDEDVKLFEVKGTVSYLDDSTRPVYSNPVQVIDSNGTIVGYVSLRKVRDELVADGTIDYATEARLLVQVGEKVYFATHGHLDEAKRYVIESLTLTTDRPLDPRIDPVGSVLL